MSTLAAGLWGVLGVLVAAGANHLADRLPRHQPLGPRPACPGCGLPYSRRQWLALLALATGRARCQECRRPLPRRRPLFEGLLGLLYAYLAWRHGVSLGLVGASFHASVLALVVVTDLEQRTVPNAVVLPAMVVAAGLTALACLRCLPRVLLGGAVAYLLFLLLALLYPGGMGYGDVKLAGYIGLVAGYPRVLICLGVGILAGGVAAALLLLSGKGGRRTYMPYAPFLVLGGLLVLLL